jgi:hypothetical protein
VSFINLISFCSFEYKVRVNNSSPSSILAVEAELLLEVEELDELLEDDDEEELDELLDEDEEELVLVLIILLHP